MVWRSISIAEKRITPQTILHICERLWGLKRVRNTHEKEGFVLSNKGHIVLLNSVNKYGTQSPPSYLVEGPPPLCVRLQVSIPWHDGTLSLCLINFLLEWNFPHERVSAVNHYFSTNLNSVDCKFYRYFVIHWVSVCQFSFIAIIIIIINNRKNFIDNNANY